MTLQPLLCQSIETVLRHANPGLFQARVKNQILDSQGLPALRSWTLTALLTCWETCRAC